MNIQEARNRIAGPFTDYPKGPMTWTHIFTTSFRENGGKKTVRNLKRTAECDLCFVSCSFVYLNQTLDIQTHQPKKTFGPSCLVGIRPPTVVDGRSWITCLVKCLLYLFSNLVRVELSYLFRNSIRSQNPGYRCGLHWGSRNLRTYWSSTSNAGCRSLGQQRRNVVQPSGIPLLPTRSGFFLHETHALQHTFSHGHDSSCLAQNGWKT